MYSHDFYLVNYESTYSDNGGIIVRIFIVKCVNLLLVAAIIFGYGVQAEKLQVSQTDKNKEINKAVNKMTPDFAEDGVYEGSGQGFGGEIKVRMTVKDKRLKKVEIISAKNETKEYLKSAMKILEDAVSKQSVKVDTVSGATLSSNGILSAMQDALDNGKVK